MIWDEFLNQPSFTTSAALNRDPELRCTLELQARSDSTIIRADRMWNDSHTVGGTVDVSGRRSSDPQRRAAAIGVSRYRSHCFYA